MRLFRKLLLPFVPIYYLITWMRNWMYDIGILKSTHFDVPTIVVGNLNVGGTGKSPMVEYVVRLLKNNAQLAILSRGYKRETHGFILATENDSAKTLGDEPFQFYNKFSEVLVAVDADRVNGISRLLKGEIKPEVVVLDDAYQHRKVHGGFNILLTAYGNLYSNDILLPTGDLREPRSGAKRADIIVVTKCPQGLSKNKREEIIKSLHVNPNQQLVFSAIIYSNKVTNALDEEFSLFELGQKEVVLITGIANPKPLVEFLKEQKITIKQHLNYPDHHHFSETEISSLKELNKEYVLLTTEKDFVRLKNEIASLFYLEIKTEFLGRDAKIFDDSLKKYVESTKKRP
ncbi:tetraacyldisaccharide 4'-kinase [Spongiivirga citrea]|uniref:Tetraacyldisaccharide 4'-kinase n=1 Tax=Spongiivirga citrea TaxID=1481457 RepID=A0A6M0CK97_9FLAO|nr:tetraacyldisaccharide 4'-kinase [Spongiivirga citrea]NER18378.1 tetraacyldisaccharide 4'-kinase [Spongiivirga citrea]